MTLAEARESFFCFMTDQKNLSDKTVINYLSDLDHFYAFLRERQVDDLRGVDTRLLRQYLSRLYAAGLARSTVSRRLSCLRSFFKHLCLQQELTVNPLTMVHTPKGVRRLPQFLSQTELEQLLDAPANPTPLELRDQALLELCNSSGLRIGETVAARIGDLDLVLGSILVRGKGRKERVVPVGSYAAAALKRYLQQGRPQLTGNGDPAPGEPLFVNWRGKGLTTRGAYGIITGYLRQTAPDRQLTPHSLRHTFATQLLEGGADLRSVQELMGHARMSSTQIYTHVSGERIKRVYQQAHPRANKRD
jgi:integrase/recombinase XerC